MPSHKIPQRSAWHAALVQILLWWLFTAALPDIFWRDARLAAAIVMGRSVLPPPASFDTTILLVATAVHVALSLAYGLLFAPLLAGRSPRQALLRGAACGLLLYGVNMYGFTLLFPWFTVARDWITALTHAVFGVTVAGVYVLLARRVGAR